MNFPMIRRLAPLIAAALLASRAGAQADTTKKPANAAGASVSADSTTESSKFSIGAGVSAGTMHFQNNAEERAIGATIAVHLWGWLDISVNPTWAWATAADTVLANRTVKGRSSSGFAALPVSLGYSRDLPGGWSPSLSIGLGFSLPTGDTLSVGSASAGYGATIGFGLAPSEKFSMNFGASHALNDAYSAGNGTSSATSLSMSSTLTVGTVGVSATYSGDVGSVPLGYETAQSLGAGLSIPIHGNLTLTLDGSAGLSAGAPTWTSSIGFGFTPAGIASVMLSPIIRARAALGAGSKIARAIKPRTKAKRVAQ